MRPRRAERAQRAEATLRLATAPRRHAQVDGGTTCAQVGDAHGCVPLFVLALGSSRRRYGEFPRAKRGSTLLACHQHAVAGFGGVTEEILDEHPKTVVLKRDWDGRSIAWPPQACVSGVEDHSHALASDGQGTGSSALKLGFFMKGGERFLFAREVTSHNGKHEPAIVLPILIDFEGIGQVCHHAALAEIFNGRCGPSSHLACDDVFSRQLYSMSPDDAHRAGYGT